MDGDGPIYKGIVIGHQRDGDMMVRNSEVVVLNISKLP